MRATSTLPLLDASALQPFVEHLRANGCPVDARLEARHIAPEQVALGTGRVSKVQAFGFFEDVVACEGVPDLGYRVGAEFGVADMGGLGRALLNAFTLEDAIQTFARYLETWVGGNRVWCEDEGDDRWLFVASTDGLVLPREVANQNGVYLLTHIVRLAAGETWCPNGVVVPHRASDALRGLSDFEGASLRLDPDVIGVRFPAELRCRSIDASRLTESHEPQPHPSGFLGSLRETLLDQLGFGGLGSLRLAAEISGVSPRTLQRRFAEEGVTFRGLVDRVRCERATRLLVEHPTLRVSQVARLVGYSGSNNFHRAFRRSTGLTPLAYRRQRGVEGSLLR